ncbi:cytochrome P450 [Janibacter cremeus]|uniref:cytochrome P450 n=1 Tax=Janibacter cremeus TaxID=1285192 RepID=UPI0023F994CE|nr:cytochrome P450 [Janibacter cremeus]WEV79005.1 cytochrome P450 [Janibacter cremeus]
MTPEVSLSLLRHGYRFQPRMAEMSGPRPTLPVRVLGRPALLVAGEEAVRLFYDRDTMARAGAVPAPLSEELFGAGAVHGTDGARHAHRKELHLSALGPDRVEELMGVLERSWVAVTSGVAAPRPGRELFDTLTEVLGGAALEWVGVGTRDVRRRSRDLMRIVDGFGSVGPRHLRGRMARRRCQAWAREAVRRARTDPGRTPVHEVARATDEGGDLLPVDVAAVELLNLVRPLVAVAWFAALVPMALQERPDWRERVGECGDDESRRAFVHELRRHYPFVPVLAARATRDIEWGGHHLARGGRVLLHVVATNHDPRTWEEPWAFRPERFEGVEPGPYEYVPQGGGDVQRGHRCPGEPATVEVLRFLVERVAELSDGQDDLVLDTTRMPTAPTPRPPRAGPDAGAGVRHRRGGWLTRSR